MAGDWMKIELELSDKPEVHYIANALNLDPDAVVGKLVRAWSWFDKHTENGHAFGVTFVTLDKVVGHAGFAEAMQFAGWLEQKDKYLCMPKFERHNGESAKKRALASKRKSRQRHAENVTETGPEKRREEVNTNTNKPPNGGETVFDFAISALGEQGIKEKTARSFLASLLRDWDALTVEAALRDAVGKTEVKAYVMSILRAKPKKGAQLSLMKRTAL